jgi:hypothetical protein
VETCVIARQVDGVLLTVGRGAKKRLVAKAIEELSLAKAKVLGTIFNGAERRDFYNAIQRRRPASAIVPAANNSPNVLSDFGPLVAAVVASLKRAVDLTFAAGNAVRAVRRGQRQGGVSEREHRRVA